MYADLEEIKQKISLLCYKNMRLLHFSPLFLALSITACQSNSSASKVPLTDSTPISSVEQAVLIVPGKSLGNIQLGQDMQAVASILGEPDAGDAAMGKAWGIWYDKDSSARGKTELSIYSSYKDSTMMAKDVKQIRTTSKRFKTEEGIYVGCSLSNFKAAYPDVELRAQYAGTSSGDTIKLYDSRAQGIGAEFTNDSTRAITVHPSGTYTNETYFTFDSKLKKIP